MSTNRFSDNRYPPPRDRSPPHYGDRRGSTNYSGGFSSSRDVPRGPKSLVDAPRGPSSTVSSGVPSGPREARARGFGRGEVRELRDAPPLSEIRDRDRDRDRDRWRNTDRDRDRDFDRRERRPSPRGRSPPARDARDSRDFPPRDLDISRARRNSRDGPPSAGSNYSDPPPGGAQSYRGGYGRGRGGDSWGGSYRGRGRGHLYDERDRRESFDRGRRSRSREPIRRDTIRDDRDMDRRDDRRDDRRFDRRDDDRRGYDSYKGPASTLGSGSNLRSLDTRQPIGGTSGPSTPHLYSSTHPSTSDRFGPADSARDDAFSRRSSVATEPLSAKERRESDKAELIASRAEASRDRYAPRASSPPPQAPQVPAFGSLPKPAQYPASVSNVWRNPALDTKPTQQSPASKPTASVAPTAPTVPNASNAPTTPATPTVSAPSASAISATPTPAPKVPQTVPSGLSNAPPTGPKATRTQDRPPTEPQTLETKPSTVEVVREQPPVSVPIITPTGPSSSQPNDASEQRSQIPPRISPPPPGLAPKSRVPPTGPQSTLKPNASPSQPYVRTQPNAFTGRDVSPGAIPSGPRVPATSPKVVPGNIPTGPKADRGPQMGGRPTMFGVPDRPTFPTARPSMAGGPMKSNIWIRPGVQAYSRPPIIPTKREYISEDRDRLLGNAPKAPRLDTITSNAEPRVMEAPKHDEDILDKNRHDRESQPERAPKDSPKISKLDTRRSSDVSMGEASPQIEKPPISAASSAPEVMEEDSDDELDLDEADFAESEAKFNREKAMLESRLIDLSTPHLRANTPLQEMILLSNITSDHLQLLDTSVPADEVVSPNFAPPPPETNTADLLTPKAEEIDDTVMGEASPALRPQQILHTKRDASVDREPTPDLSSLPYLGNGPPTPLSDPDHEPPAPPESLMIAIRDSIRQAATPLEDVENGLDQYEAWYRDWKASIAVLDEQKEQEEQENRQQSVDPGPKVVTPDIVSASAMAPILEQPVGRRAHSTRWATEYDLQQVLKESIKTLEEEKGKKDREPKRSNADPEREAYVAEAISDYEAQRRQFRDTNFARPQSQSTRVFHYAPPEDDFTELEHQIMVKHYRTDYPKKWGKLAEMLYKEAGTSRTYKDTINHYYATKWGKEYKGRVKRRYAKKARGGGAGRGRAAAANSERPELYGEDGLAPLAMTDSGRPRRAAAPTFGTESEFENATPAQTPARLRGSRPDNADATSEKPGRRGKVAKEKVGRRPKTQPLLAAPAGSPVKVDRKDRSLGPKPDDGLGRRMMEEAPYFTTALPAQGLVDDQLLYQEDTFAQAGLNATISDRQKSQQQRAGPSSYWSVLEQTDFRRNVAHFGTDFAAIAHHMGTKTQTMVKNQYQRLVESGGNPELAQAAADADARRQAGEDLGPPPTPTPVAKRRDISQTAIPRPLAPNPDAADLANISTSQSSVPPHASPPFNPPRLSSIGQATNTQPKPVIASQPPQSAPTEPQAQMSPPVSHQQISQSQAQSSRNQHQHAHHHHSHSQHKPAFPGPRAGFFSDDASRTESRPPSQSAMAQPAARSLHQLHPQAHSQQQAPESAFRPSLTQQEREMQARLEQQQDRDSQVRYQQQHARRFSQEVLQRQYPQNPSGAAQMMSHNRPMSSAAGSPETRPLTLQQQIMHPPQSHQPVGQHMIDTQAQPPNTVHPTPQRPHQPVHTPPVKEEPRPYPMPAAPPSTHATPAPTKPAEAPRKSNLMSLLNDAEPEEPRRKRPSEQSVPSHTPTPQQQAPIAPPPPSQSVPRRDVYSDMPATQSAYGRPVYSQQQFPPSMQQSRQVVDLTREQASSNRPHARDSWPPRPSFHPGQMQSQQGPQTSSPHPALAQPNLSESRLLANHRSVFAQHNAPRHNPSPPPHTAYTQSPHLHSRTPSLTQAPAQQPRHNVTPNPLQSAQQGPGSAQILQQNPYASLDPPGSSSQPSGPVGMRPSPHNQVPQQEIGRGMNDRAQSHNTNLAYSNPQTPSEGLPPHQHLRGPTISEQFRPRDPRDIDFDAQNRERDVSRELSQRADLMMRERETMHAGSQHRGSASQPSLPQDPRYASQPPPDRFQPPGRSHTPLGRAEYPQPPPHSQHASMQHPHSILLNNVYRQQEEDRQNALDEAHRQRQQDDRLARFRESHISPLSQRDDRYAERMRDPTVRDARFREDMMRRERERAGPPGPYQIQPPAAQPPAPPGQPQPRDWTLGVRRWGQREDEYD